MHRRWYLCFLPGIIFFSINVCISVPGLALGASEDLLKQILVEIDSQQSIIDKYKVVVSQKYEESPEPDEQTLRLVDESNNHYQFLVNETMLLV